MAEAESKGSRVIAARMKEIEPGTPRYEVLEIARRFKTSWVDLGGRLHDVRSKKMYQEWGYKKFEEYCRDEIRIKPRTAAKLTASFAFLKTEDPSVLRRDGVAKPVPDIAVVDLLRRIKEKEDLPEREFKKIKDLAYNDAPASEVRREIREQLPAEERPTKSRQIRQLVEQANRLADAVASVPGIPHVIVQRALALVDDLRALVTNHNDDH